MALGVLLILSGVAYDVFIAGNDERYDLPARILGVAGVATMFGTAIGTGAYLFYKRQTTPGEVYRARWWKD